MVTATGILYPLNIPQYVVYLTHPSPNSATPDYNYALLAPESGNPERQLWALVFLSNNHREDRHFSQSPDFLSIFRKGETKLPDECDQECVHLDEAISRKQ